MVRLNQPQRLVSCWPSVSKLIMAIPETTWIHLLDERAPHLIEEVAPTKLLPYLNLPKWDKENIVCDERNLGPAYATSTLLDKLKRRNGPKGWKTFDALVRALRNIGNQQSALLLDPHFKGNKYTIWKLKGYHLRSAKLSIKLPLNDAGLRYSN